MMENPSLVQHLTLLSSLYEELSELASLSMLAVVFPEQTLDNHDYWQHHSINEASCGCEDVPIIFALFSSLDTAPGVLPNSNVPD